jgi:hypothetical protein
MRPSSRCEYGSREWIFATCRESGCPVVKVDSDGTRGKWLEKCFPQLSDEEIVQHALAGTCGFCQSDAEAVVTSVRE